MRACRLSPKAFGKISLELAAVAGLPDRTARRDALAVRVLLNAGRQARAGRSAQPFGEGPEERAAGHFPRRVWNRGETGTLRLCPAVRDAVQILAIGADLLNKSPQGLPLRELLLALKFPAALLREAMLAPDAL